jgi:HSP20 family protein
MRGRAPIDFGQGASPSFLQNIAGQMSKEKPMALRSRKTKAAPKRTVAVKSSARRSARPKKSASASASREVAQSPIGDLRRDIDHAFERMLGGRPFMTSAPFNELFDKWGGNRGNLGSDWFSVPSVDMSETKSGFRIKAELPGLDEKDVEVSIRDDILTIKGEKKSETERDEKGAFIKERRFGSFQRSIRLPDEVNEDKIKAKFAKGVLTINCPAKRRSKSAETKVSIS